MSASSVWPCTVGDIERALYEAFPRAWAEPWDRVGLVAGDPRERVTNVAFALDASVDAVREAHARGANVLVTHHPVCLDMPRTLRPREAGGSFAGGCLWEALTRGVALIAMHTNLDRSPLASLALPARLGLEAKPGLEPGRDAGEGGLGSVAVVAQGLSVEAFARRCREAFGRVAQVFGDPGQTVSRAAFFTGSLGDCGKHALAVRADVVVCGECGYHRALDLIDRGCAVIILGHDASELPLVDVLEQSLASWGLPEACSVRLGARLAWQPDASAGL